LATLRTFRSGPVPSRLYPHSAQSSFARIRASEKTKAQQTRHTRYRVFKGKGSRIPAFSTNWKFLAEAYVRYRCRNYGRIEKLISGRYDTVLEMAYEIRPANN
jgi:hypothetical protein